MSSAPAAAEGGRRVFRSSLAKWFGYAWLVFAVLNGLDLVARGHDKGALVTGAFLLLATAVVYVTCLRPRIVADAAALRVTNPLRDIVVPWPSMDRVDATYAIRLHTRDGRRFRCWVLQSPSRPRARARLRPARGATGTRTAMGGRATAGRPSQDPGDLVRGRTQADFVAGQLDEMVQLRSRSADVDARGARASWSLSAVASLVVPAALVAAALLVP